jgi:hypothetical protein
MQDRAVEAIDAALLRASSCRPRHEVVDAGG